MSYNKTAYYALIILVGIILVLVGILIGSLLKPGTSTPPLSATNAQSSDSCVVTGSGNIAGSPDTTYYTLSCSNPQEWCVVIENISPIAVSCVT